MKNIDLDSLTYPYLVEAGPTITSAGWVTLFNGAAHVSVFFRNPWPTSKTEKENKAALKRRVKKVANSVAYNYANVDLDKK